MNFSLIHKQFLSGTYPNQVFLAYSINSMPLSLCKLEEKIAVCSIDFFSQVIVSQSLSSTTELVAVILFVGFSFFSRYLNQLSKRIAYIHIDYKTLRYISIDYKTLIYINIDYKTLSSTFLKILTKRSYLGNKKYQIICVNIFEFKQNI